MPLPERRKPMRRINLVEKKRSKICFGHGKFELPVRNLSRYIEAIKYSRCSFCICKMFKRWI